jgi:hypothetical protein
VEPIQAERKLQYDINSEPQATVLNLDI